MRKSLDLCQWPAATNLTEYSDIAVLPKKHGFFTSFGCRDGAEPLYCRRSDTHAWWHVQGERILRLSSVPARVVEWQVAVGCVGAMIWLLHRPQAALAALAGGVGSALLSMHFAARVFSRTELAPPQSIVAAFYRAEAFKLLSAALMFGLMAKYFAEWFVPFLSTFAATLAVFFVALLWVVSDGTKESG